jgi:hypothetical protein
VAQLIPAKEIQFDRNLKVHHIREVINRLSVPTFPFIASCDVLVQLMLPGRHSEMIELRVMDKAGSVLTLMQFEARNVREPSLPPGCDISLGIRFLTEKEGIYEIQAIGMDRVLAQYHLYIGIGTN